MSGKKNRKKLDNEVTPMVPRRRKRVHLEPRNTRQKRYMDLIRDHDITLGSGAAGTGKTHIASLLAVQYLTEQLVDRIIICRPAVEAGGERIGFLPGGINEKLDPFIKAIFDAFRTYWGPQTIQQHLMDEVIEIVPLAYMRGRSFRNCFIIADEMQNSTPDNILMLLSRLGEGSKMVITGDPSQRDIYGADVFTLAYDKLGHLEELAFIQFTNEDVVRHPTVKKILDAWSGTDNREGGDSIEDVGFLRKTA